MKAKFLTTLAIITSMALITASCSTPSCPEIGSKAPNFTLKNVDGESVSLSDFEGRPIIINFWSTRCVPCVAEMPHIQAVHDKLSSQGLVVLSINISDSAAAAKDFATEYGLTFPILLDPQMTVSQKYCLPQAIPITLFINTEGAFKAGKAGAFQSIEEIEDMLESL